MNNTDTPLNINQVWTISGYTVIIEAMVPGRIGYSSESCETGNKTYHTTSVKAFRAMIARGYGELVE